jgi:hypothetical protein
MIVVVTGGRDFTDRDAVWAALTALHVQHPITELIEGEASGVDTFCREWAEQFNIPVRRCPAEWGDLTVPGAVLMNAIV